MAGYAKSVVFPASSTLPELVVALFGGEHPEFAYKLYVLISAAAVPWLIALACVALAGSRRRNGDRRLARPALHLDRFPDQLRGVRDAAVLSGDPAGPGRDGGLRALPDRGGAVSWLVGGGPHEPGVPRPPDDRDGHRPRRPRWPTSRSIVAQPLEPVARAAAERGACVRELGSRLQRDG